MSTSKFCIQQRQKEQQRLKKLLIFGFTGSAVLHGILAYALPRWSFEPPTQAQEPIELIIVDKPQPKPKPKQVVQPKQEPVVEPEPEPEPEPVVEPELEPKPIVEPEPEPKLEPKKVLTTPEPALQKPMVSAPVENTAPPPLKPIAPLPSRSPKTRGKSPGWVKGVQRSKKKTYPITKKSYSRPKKSQTKTA